MRPSKVGFTSELQISSPWMILILVAVGHGVLAMSYTVHDLSQRLQVQFGALGVYALSLVAWLLARWRPKVGTWCVIVALIDVARLCRRTASL